MRTTVARDPDVMDELKAYAHRRNLSFKAALNSAVRAGITAERGGARPYKMPVRPLGLRSDIDLTHASQLAEALEEEEIIRKLELGK
jgi:hypothetical protein